MIDLHLSPKQVFEISAGQPLQGLHPGSRAPGAVRELELVRQERTGVKEDLQNNLQTSEEV